VKYTTSGCDANAGDSELEVEPVGGDVAEAATAPMAGDRETMVAVLPAAKI
jgi:hypothetical protein